MAKKNKNTFEQPPVLVPAQPVPCAPTASWRRINNCFPVPVAPPADFIQLTPVVQPIPLVPYATQEQPFLYPNEPQY